VLLHQFQHIVIAGLVYISKIQNPVGIKSQSSQIFNTVLRSGHNKIYLCALLFQKAGNMSECNRAGMAACEGNTESSH
jgi:hypothetical protein